MSVVQNICKHFKTADVEVGSGFDPPVIPFVPKTTNLKADNAQEFNLCMSINNKNSMCKVKAFTFSNGTPEYVLEWEKKMKKVVKCKPVDTAESQFNLVEALLKGDALTHWMEFERVETTRIIKNLDGTEKLAK
eukprot:15050913-Ditylum_brightwellii.AAC.1